MIRIIVRESDAGMAANVGGDVHTKYRTVDIVCEELEALLRARDNYISRTVIGAELVAPKEPTA